MKTCKLSPGEEQAGIVVRVIKPFKRNTELITRGTVLEVPGHVLPQLQAHGLVEIINDPHKLIGETLAEVDREGRPWPRGFFQNLSEDIRSRIRIIQRSIDEAAMAGDIEELIVMLTEWRKVLLSVRTFH